MSETPSPASRRWDPIGRHSPACRSRPWSFASAQPAPSSMSAKPACCAPSGVTASVCGRTLEVSFGLQNADWCQDVDRKPLGLKLRGQIATPAALATGLHKRVIGQYFDKTKFALGVLARKEEQWTVPRYIELGLQWLEKIVELEVKEEVEAAAEGLAADIVAGGENAGGEQ